MCLMHTLLSHGHHGAMASGMLNSLGALIKTVAGSVGMSL